MLTYLENLFQKIANWKTVLVLFIISFPLGYYIDDPIFYMVPRFDYLYSFSVYDAYGLISYFQLIGRLKAYIAYELTFQVFFPFVTALFFITFIYYTGSGLVPKKILIPFALIIPTTTLLIDYLENTGLIILFRSFRSEPGQALTYSFFVSKLKTTVEITSGFATIKGFLWDMQFLIFFAGIAISIFKLIRFSLTKTGFLEKFKKNSASPFLNTSSDDYEKDFENKIRKQTNVIQTNSQELPKAGARSNIVALVGVIGLICILAFIVIFLRSVSPYVSY